MLLKGLNAEPDRAAVRPDVGVIHRDYRTPRAVRERKPFVIAYPQANVTASPAARAVRISKGSGRNCQERGFLGKMADFFD
jgi:hypothetical protein